MSTLSPLLVRRPVEYLPYRNCRTYVSQKSSRYPDPGFRDSFDSTPELRALMEAVGYARVDRFRNDRRVWDELAVPVPLRYLDAIGVDLHVLEFALEEDVALFDQALEAAAPRDSFLIRVGEETFMPYLIPDQIFESERIEFLKAFAEESGYECRLGFGGVKTMVAYPGGRSVTVLHTPSMEQRGDRVYFRVYSDTGELPLTQR
jgi:hypothetical protein